MRKYKITLRVGTVSRILNNFVIVDYYSLGIEEIYKTISQNVNEAN